MLHSSLYLTFTISFFFYSRKFSRHKEEWWDDMRTSTRCSVSLVVGLLVIVVASTLFHVNQFGKYGTFRVYNTETWTASLQGAPDVNTSALALTPLELILASAAFEDLAFTPDLAGIRRNQADCGCFCPQLFTQRKGGEGERPSQSIPNLPTRIPGHGNRPRLFSTRPGFHSLSSHAQGWWHDYSHGFE